jgi:hypothetical protein
MMPACDRTPGNLSMRVRDNEIDEAPGVQVSEQLERLVNSASIRSGYASLLGHVASAILLAVLTIRPTTSKQLRPLILGFNPEPSGMAATFEAAPQPHPAASSRESSLPSSETVSEPADPDTAFPLHPSDATPAEASPQAPEDTAEVLADSSAGEPEPVAIVSTSSSDGEVKSGLAMRRAAATRAAGQSLRHPRSVGLHGGVRGVPFANRSGDIKRDALQTHGGTAASEQAVARGLEWLAAHQGPDGSWRCDLANSRCRGACRNPGSTTGSIGPTALALLPFLGAGSTHLDGPYQETVSRGLYFLTTSIRPGPRGGDLCEGSMYAHGIAVLAMAEAYGMTNDDFLEPLLRETVRFTETSQDLHGGGWRYLPGQAGDTTVTGWQVVSLKSAAMAGVPVRSPTIDGVTRFLDSVQNQGGAAYGYRTPAAKPSTSAVGLLSRMYTGWTPDDEPLWRGMTQLAAQGPSPHAIYENFYLAQVLMQADHPVWPRWNATNRDQIIRQQGTYGHETGSWFFADPDSAPGGRLAHTALALLTLEVYYRLLPIYRQEAVDGGF